MTVAKSVVISHLINWSNKITITITCKTSSKCAIIIPKTKKMIKNSRQALPNNPKLHQHQLCRSQRMPRLRVTIGWQRGAIRFRVESSSSSTRSSYRKRLERITYRRGMVGWRRIIANRRALLYKIRIVQLVLEIVKNPIFWHKSPKNCNKILKTKRS